MQGSIRAVLTAMCVELINMLLQALDRVLQLHKCSCSSFNR